MNKFLTLLLILLTSCEIEKIAVIEKPLPIIDYTSEVVITEVTDGFTKNVNANGKKLINGVNAEVLKNAKNTVDSDVEENDRED